MSWQSEQATSNRSFLYILDFRKSEYCWCGLFEWTSSGQMLSSRPAPRIVGPFLTGSVYFVISSWRLMPGLARSPASVTGCVYPTVGPPYPCLRSWQRPHTALDRSAERYFGLTM